MRTKISKKQFERARETIKSYEKQVNEERTKLFRKSLKKYDQTYWKYKKPMQTIYLWTRVENNSIVVTQFTKHSNGLLDIHLSHFDTERMENYLSTLSEFEYSETFGDKKNYLFKRITFNTFKRYVESEIMEEMGFEFA